MATSYSSKILDCDKVGSKMENFEVELDQVYDMLNRLTSYDRDVSETAKDDIDKYLEERKIKEQKSEMVEETRVTSSRSLINNKDILLENRRIKAESLKDEGNREFKSGNFKKAMELYTSAIMEYDQESTFFTNRAQSYIQLKSYELALADCHKASKLKPEAIKPYIHMARALKEMKRFGEAVEMLETAEQISHEHTLIIQKYKTEVILAQKQDFLGPAKD